MDERSHEVDLGTMAQSLVRELGCTHVNAAAAAAAAVAAASKLYANLNQPLHHKTTSIAAAELDR